MLKCFNITSKKVPDYCIVHYGAGRGTGPGGGGGGRVIQDPGSPVTNAITVYFPCNQHFPSLRHGF